MTKAKFIAFYLLSFFLLIMSVFISQFELFRAMNVNDILASVFFFDKYIIDFLFVLILSMWLIQKKKIYRISAYFLVWAYVVSNVIQVISLIRGTEFISKLAMENLNHISLLVNMKTIIATLVLLIYLLVLPYFIEKKISKKMLYKHLSSLTFKLLIFGLIINGSEAWLSQVSKVKRDLYCTLNLMDYTSPSRALYDTVFIDKEDVEALNFTDNEIKTLNKFGISLNLNQKYIFKKEKIYSGEIPFEGNETNVTKPNIIVFFTEGYAARTMGVYNDKFKKLTPNLVDFSEHSMVVKNYYNHTAATYRGIRGQLCSTFPRFNGAWHIGFEEVPDISYLSLANIFKDEGYDTVFFDTHRKESGYLDNIVYELGFEKVFTAEELTKRYLNNEEPLRPDSLSDNQFYKGFIGYLKEIENKQTKPFLIGLYNLGTHAFQDISQDGTKYEDGDNHTLNTIHTLDDAFGEFWEFYKNSSYSKNTVVIFTTDHTHFTEREYIKIIDDPSYQKVFIDHIPLIIHDPRKKLPKTYDAKNATSISLAPSLIHYIGLKNRSNPFVGRSIFENNSTKVNLGVGWYDDNYFITGENKIYELKTADKYQSELKVIEKFILKLQKQEIKNLLWDDSNNKTELIEKKNTK